MANTLTSLTPTIYEALDVVSREQVGFIPAVTKNTSVERAALNETILYPVTPTVSIATITPGVTAPDTGDQTIGNDTMTLSNSKAAFIRWNGEEQKGVGNAGFMQQILRDQFAQAFRALTNQIESDVAVAAKNGASRAYGTAGTTPFATAADFSDAAQTRKILEDNGCPIGDLHLVLSTSAAANVRGKQSQLFKVNEAGSAEMLRSGAIGAIEGFNVHVSNQVASHTAGTGNLSTTNAAGYAVGATSLTLASAGTGTLLQGDVLTFAGDTNKYIVNTGDSDVSNGGTLVLNQPGIRIAMSAATKAITVGAAYSANVAFDKGAIHLAVRPPAVPQGGDAADDVMIVVDPISGLPFQISVYKQYKQNLIEIAAVWGVKVVKSAHVATLLG